MVELIKKSVLVGIGLAFMTKEKAEEAAKKLVEEAKLKSEEGKKAVEELLKKSDEAKKNIEKFVDTAVHKALMKLNLPSREEVSRLEERIRRLESENAGSGK